MSRRDPQRTGQLLQGAGALGLALAAHPQYEHEDELPEQTGSGPGGTPAPGSPMKKGHRWQSHPGAGSNNLKLPPQMVEYLGGEQADRAGVITRRSCPRPHLLEQRPQAVDGGFDALPADLGHFAGVALALDAGVVVGPIAWSSPGWPRPAPS